MPDKLVDPSSDEIKSSHTAREPRSPEPEVALFSNNNWPDNTVVAPAPSTGLSIGAGSL